MVEVRRHLISTRYGQVHCREAGSGPAIILLHINQQSSALYLELMHELAPDMRVVAMDYPSHGMSDHISTQPMISDYAACAAEVMEALGLDRFLALGEATGAAVCIELGNAQSALVEGLVLLNCPFYFKRDDAHRAHAELKGGLRPADTSGFPLTRTLDYMRDVDPAHAPLSPSQSWMDRINVAQIEVGRDRWQALDALNNFDVAGGLAQLECPTVLLMAEHFHYTHLLDEYVARIRSLVAAEVVEGARFCMGWEKPQIIAEKVRALAGKLKNIRAA